MYIMIGCWRRQRMYCKHINLAANICGYAPINLGKIIENGVLSDIESIHRMTIDRAVEKKQMGEELRE